MRDEEEEISSDLGGSRDLSNVRVSGVDELKQPSHWLAINPFILSFPLLLLFQHVPSPFLLLWQLALAGIISPSYLNGKFIRSSFII